MAVLTTKWFVRESVPQFALPSVPEVTATHQGTAEREQACNGCSVDRSFRAVIRCGRRAECGWLVKSSAAWGLASRMTCNPTL